MSGAALTFSILGKSCVVILPPSLDGVPAANDDSEPVGAMPRDRRPRSGTVAAHQAPVVSVVKEACGDGERVRDPRRGTGR
jgi:hypothetical protein